MLSTGSRTLALSMVLIILVSYSMLIRKIPLIVFLCIFLFGSSLMYFLVLVRELGINDAGSVAHAQQSFKSTGSFLDVFMDLISNNRNLYVLVD